MGPEYRVEPRLRTESVDDSVLLLDAEHGAVVRFDGPAAAVLRHIESGRSCAELAPAAAEALGRPLESGFIFTGAGIRRRGGSAQVKEEHAQRAGDTEQNSQAA